MKTILRTLFCLVLTGLAAGAANDPATINSRYQKYHAAGKAVVEMALNKKIDPGEISKQVEVMVTEAVWFAEAYGQAHPKGAKLLKIITDSVEAMKKLSFKELEHEWHDLHHFDKITDLGLDLKAEANEHFTDPIHAIVHPLLVLKAAQAYATSKSEADLKNLREEMEEGLEQIEKARDALLKK